MPLIAGVGVAGRTGEGRRRLGGGVAWVTKIKASWHSTTVAMIRNVENAGNGADSGFRLLGGFRAPSGR
ncbi:hypothetical protein GCM10009610_38690 [Pseudonocardia xinjiangensis]